MLHGFCYRSVVEDSIGAADDIRFVAVLVNRVRRLSRCRWGEFNLEDDVNPGVVFGADGEVRIEGVRRLGAEEEWGVEILIEAIGGVAIQCPILVRALAAEVENVGCICCRCRCRGREGNKNGFV